MSNSIHYKFKPGTPPPSPSGWQTIHFSSSSLECIELKRTIVTVWNLLSAWKEPFDIQISNQTTGEEYKDDHYAIHRGTSVSLKKSAPTSRQQYEKLKVPPDVSNVAIAMNTEDESVINLMKNENLLSSNSIKPLISSSLGNANGVKTHRGPPSHLHSTLSATSVPPMGYVCKRCGDRGHYIQFCPKNGDNDYDPKRNISFAYKPVGAGMPSQFIAKISDPKGMEGEGKMIQSVNNNVQATAVSSSQSSSPSSLPIPLSSLPPSDYLCPLCKSLLTSATVITCCYSSFCLHCIQKVLKDSGKCPQCHNKADDSMLIPNEKLQRAVDDWKEKATIQQEREKERVRKEKEKKIENIRENDTATAASMSSSSAPVGRLLHITSAGINTGGGGRFGPQQQRNNDNQPTSSSSSSSLSYDNTQIGDQNHNAHGSNKRNRDSPTVQQFQQDVHKRLAAEQSHSPYPYPAPASTPSPPSAVSSSVPTSTPPYTTPSSTYPYPYQYPPPSSAPSAPSYSSPPPPSASYPPQSTAYPSYPYPYNPPPPAPIASAATSAPSYPNYDYNQYNPNANTNYGYPPHPPHQQSYPPQPPQPQYNYSYPPAQYQPSPPPPSTSASYPPSSYPPPSAPSSSYPYPYQYPPPPAPIPQPYTQH